MAGSTTRACSACHAAKVKCVKVEGSNVCKRCARLGLKCVEHVSRQGQGTRRRNKKTKTKIVKNEDDTVNEALHISQSLTPRSNCAVSVSPIPTAFCHTTASIRPPECRSEMTISSLDCNKQRNNNGSIKDKAQESLCSGMDSLAIEDNLICKTITNGIGKDHYGLNLLIRQWIALSFSRRSFSLLARAAFLAAKLHIPMDDIISNQSPFAAMTDSQPMEFLANELLLPKGERKTLGYPIDLQEIPWEMLDSVQIDHDKPEESVRHRCASIRWTVNGTCRYWTSPLFDIHFATTDEVGEVWERNDNKEIVDLFLVKSEKGKFAQNVFNAFFVNHKPNMPSFVTKAPYKVKNRKGEIFETDLIQTIKLLDLDSMIQYIEVVLPQNQDYQPRMRPESLNKRRLSDGLPLDINDDSLVVDDNIDFTDFTMTEEMEEIMKLLNGEE